MRSVFIIVVVLILSIVVFSCQEEGLTNIENEKEIPDIQQASKRNDDVNLDTGSSTFFTLADHYLVEFIGSADELDGTVSLLNGSVDEVFTEIGIAKVSGLGITEANLLSKAKGVINVARDMNVPLVFD